MPCNLTHSLTDSLIRSMSGALVTQFTSFKELFTAVRFNWNMIPNHLGLGDLPNL